MAEREISGGWQPIETAPRDGSAFLAWSPDAASHGVMLIFSGPDGEWIEEWSYHTIDAQPTLWQPITPPDASETEGRTDA